MVYIAGRCIVTSEQMIPEGDNCMALSLTQEDKDFVILLIVGGARELKISRLMLDKLQ